MRIVALSDLHGYLPDVPECDLLILSGDLTGGNWTGISDGTEEFWHKWLFGRFREWLRDQKYRMAVAVGGNHDTVFLKYHGLPEEIVYLCDSGAEFEGVKIWGAPWVMKFDQLAFNLSEPELIEKWALVPDDTDILVCHGPPRLAGDKVARGHVGDPWLRKRILEVQPDLVTCGHIHEGRGIYSIDKTTVINAAFDPVEWELQR